MAQGITLSHPCQNRAASPKQRLRSRPLSSAPKARPIAAQGNALGNASRCRQTGSRALKGRPNPPRRLEIEKYTHRPTGPSCTRDTFDIYYLFRNYHKKSSTLIPFHQRQRRGLSQPRATPWEIRADAYPSRSRALKGRPNSPRHLKPKCTHVASQTPHAPEIPSLSTTSLETIAKHHPLSSPFHQRQRRDLS